jgi:F-type H+-transporting ATPase subunit epsilon
MLQVTVQSRKEIIFEGMVESVFLPGEYGEFEVLPFHAPIISTLKKGKLRIDDLFLEIKGGIAKMGEDNKLLLLVE